VNESQTVVDRAATSSRAEDAFVGLFQEVFGIEKTQLLVHEFPYKDFLGKTRFIDFALKTTEHLIAFEIDGPDHYNPAISGSLEAFLRRFEDDLLRQNSLISDRWRVFRWSDRQLGAEPEFVKEQLSLFLASVPGLLEFDDFLPKQHGGVVELREHQADARQWLERLRAEGKTIGLLNHATGTGKTITAIADAQAMNGPTLYLAHRRELVQQTARKFNEFWPHSNVGIWLGSRRDDPAQHQVICASVQSLADALQHFDSDSFDYIIVDEAHHAPAETYKRILCYFRPKFLLGLTATPDRPDGASVLSFFQDSTHRMSLEEAVRKGELVPIRCVRVRTNVDLSCVRYNQIQYNSRDLETAVLVPARDELIVQTYMAHVSGLRTVVFCVNVQHAERLAEAFRDEGVAAESVSGRDNEERRRTILNEFERGEIHVLCACDILNEGWDCPAVEVLFMARPTLSKIIYLQQLGRGTRKAPGKKCLFVFDFVDNAGRYNSSLSLHRLLGQKQYRPGGMVLAPDQELQEERARYKRGEKPEAILNLSLEIAGFEEIDLFNWQETVKGMIALSDLDLELAVAEGTVRRALDRGEIPAPDHTLELGTRTYHYYRRERIPEIREALGVPEVTSDTIKRLFFEFISEMDMSASYKPVLMLAFLDCATNKGRANVAELTSRFKHFYLGRHEAGRVVERGNMRMARVAELSDSDVQSVIVSMPLKKFRQRHYLEYARDVAWLQFNRALWTQLDDSDLEKIRQLCRQNLQRYYARLGTTI
jgi:superfamily II DNA or RNA helicase